MELREPALRKRPKRFNPVDVASAIRKLIGSMVESVMLLVAQVYKPAYDALQRGFCAIRDDFGVYFASSFKESQKGCFSVSAASSFALDSSPTEVGFIDFDFSLEGRLLLGELGDALPDQGQIPVQGISI